MSLSSALNIAFTGLKANTRAAGVVSTNISNATNEAYGRRELGLSALSAGNLGGVNVTTGYPSIRPCLACGSHGVGREVGQRKRYVQLCQSVGRHGWGLRYCGIPDRSCDVV